MLVKYKIIVIKHYYNSFYQLYIFTYHYFYKKGLTLIKKIYKRAKKAALIMESKQCYIELEL